MGRAFLITSGPCPRTTFPGFRAMPPELREERFLEHQWARGAFCQLFREPKALGDLSLQGNAAHA